MTEDNLVERLRDRKIVADTNPWLRADDLCVEAADRIEAQAAEIERLRAALTQIARMRTDLRGDFSLGSHQSDIARAALAGKAEQ